MRPAILLVLASVVSSLPRTQAGDEAGGVTVVWPGNLVSRGACVEKPTWFVSVVPGPVEIEAIDGVTLRFGDQEVSGRVLHLDPGQRLCLLEAAEAPLGSRPLTLATATTPRAGSRAECLAGGSPCRTTVAGKDWSYQGVRFPLPLLRLRVSDEGSRCEAGTPMVNPEGELVGLLTCFKLKPPREVYAIPASRIAKVVDDVREHRRSGPVWVGLVLHEHSSTPEVLKVKSGSPADTAGLRPGDVVLSMNGVEIETFDDLDEAIQNLPAGKAAAVRVLRGLEETTLSLVPRFADLTAASR